MKKFALLALVAAGATLLMGTSTATAGGPMIRGGGNFGGARAGFCRPTYNNFCRPNYCAPRCQPVYTVPCAPVCYTPPICEVPVQPVCEVPVVQPVCEVPVYTPIYTQQYYTNCQPICRPVFKQPCGPVYSKVPYGGRSFAVRSGGFRR